MGKQTKVSKYKIGGLSFNSGEDVEKTRQKGKFKANIDFKFESSLDNLSLDGIFESGDIKPKKKESKKVIEVDLSKKKKKKKGNELI
jgi:hypothetical protein